MPKAARATFVCQSCGQRSLKWLGRCPDCGAWNSYVEELSAQARGRSGEAREAGKAVPLSEVSALNEARASTGIAELDRVLGGGLVAGAAVLLGGDPGIGKSTLLLAALDRMAKRLGGALYVSGEESLRQTRLRADRLGAGADELLVLAETDCDAVLTVAEKLRPRVLAVDSIQTLYLSELGSAPGSVAQVRECAARLVAHAKRTETPLFMVGHVTKDGALAGPRVLEHMVDTVLYFEGDKGAPFRVLRAHKNRFGSTNEIGVFEMRGSGLREVADPSALFLEGRPRSAAGSVVTASLTGTRPVLCEVQALVAQASYGTGRRTALGVDPNRVAMLAAVLEKKVGLSIVGCDLFVNAAGGVDLGEPAADLAVAAALASSHRNVAAPAGTVVVGEVGLTGEVRGVQQIAARLAEAAKLGFTAAVVPEANARHAEAPRGMAVVGVATVEEALVAILG